MSRREGFGVTAFQVRCGQCIGCRITVTQSWAARALHENQMHDESIFLTCTYNEENVPYGGTLVKDHHTKFVKDMRNRGHQFRYFMCGEYGDQDERPHLHYLLFGYRPDDARAWRETDGYKTYISDYLAEVWGKGNIEFGDVTYASAAYVAGYVRKKQWGQSAKEHYQWVDPDTGQIIDRVPEFALSSLKPGIGEAWFKRYGPEILRHGHMVVNGSIAEIPRYYLKLAEKLFPREYSRYRAREAQQHHVPLQKRIVDIGHGREVIRIGTFEEEKMTENQIYARSMRRMITREKILKSKQTRRTL